MIKKLNVIIDDKTILNFPYLFKLLKRYRFITLLTPLIVIAFSVYYYQSQNDLQLATNSFEYAPQSRSTATEVIGELLGQETNRLTPDEILTIGLNPAFISNLAEAMYNDASFKELNFNGVRSKSLKSFHDFFGHCQNEKKCVLTVLRGKLPSFYNIDFDEEFRHRFVLKVISLDNLTSTIILKHMKKQIVELRRSALTSYISNQENLTKKLLEKQNAVSINAEMARLEREKENLQLDQRTVASHLTNSLKRLDSLKVSVDYMEEKLSFLKKRKVTKEKGTQREVNVKTLVKKIDQLKTDIAALESSSSSKDTGSQEILNELRKELGKKKRSLASYGDISIYESDVRIFDKSLNSSKRNLQIEYNVNKENYANAEETHSKLVASKRAIEYKLKNIDLKISKYAPDVEYMNKLNNKLVQLQLVHNTIVADIKFSEDSDIFNRVKRVKREKVIVFSIFFSILLTLMLVFIRFSFDSKIYDTEELLSTFGNLNIIGNTPEFD